MRDLSAKALAEADVMWEVSLSFWSPPNRGVIESSEIALEERSVRRCDTLFLRRQL